MTMNITKLSTKLRIQGVSPEEFASYFGADPVYMKAPNLPGDGYLFYNFSAVERTPEWCAEFIPAIDRTSAAFKGKEHKKHRADLRKLRVYVASFIPEKGRPDFYKLDTFTRSYIEAALCSSNDESDPETGGEPMDRNYSHVNIATETMVDMVADCAKFQADNAADLATIGDESQAGYDFWMTRVHSGVGYSDRNNGDTGDRLDAAAEKCGERHLCVGDDGKIYIER